MCGFLFSKGLHLSIQQQNKVTELIRHRGPDQEGLLIKKDLYLFHSRLSILDPQNKKAQQPMISPCQKWVIVYNGEIYNYQKLAQQFKIELQTSCDTELLLKLYIKIKENMLNHLEGMFAFVIVNLETGTFFIARDRLGIKPLFFFKNESLFICASEIAPLLEIGPPQKICEIGLRQYKLLRTTFGTHTLYNNIHSFLPGHYMKKEKISPYWKIDFSCNNDNISEKKVGELIDSSIKKRLLSDKKVGTFLSGGLDSSLVSYKVNDFLKEERIHTFTIGFKNNNEFDYAQIVQEKINSIHHEHEETEKDYLKKLHYMIQKRCLPLSVPNEVLIYQMSLDAKKNDIHVLLSGEGADELFCGYNRIFDWAFLEKNKPFNINQFSKYYCYGENDLDILEYTLQPFIKKYQQTFQIVSAFFQIYHLSGLLNRLDHSCSLAGLESRPIFTDHHLVEYMAQFTYQQKSSLQKTKKTLKKIAQPFLPDKIVNRKKVGFPVKVEDFIDSSYGKSGYHRWLNYNLKQIERTTKS